MPLVRWLITSKGFHLEEKQPELAIGRPLDRLLWIGRERETRDATRSHLCGPPGKPEAYRQAIFDSLYRAMRDALNVPEDDQFMTISEHDAANFRTGNAYGVYTQRRRRLHPDHRVPHPHPRKIKVLFRRIAQLALERPAFGLRMCL